MVASAQYSGAVGISQNWIKGFQQCSPIELSLPGEKELVWTVCCHGKRGNRAVGGIQPTASATTKGKRGAGMATVAFGQPPLFCTGFWSRSRGPLHLMNVSIMQQQELPAWLSRCQTCPQECVRMCHCQCVSSPCSCPPAAVQPAEQLTDDSRSLVPCVLKWFINGL